MRAIAARHLFAPALLAVLLAPTAAAQRDWSKVEMRTTPLGPGLSMIEGAGGNLAVSVGEDGVFLVDDQYAPLTEKIVAAVRALSDKPIRFVLNTHWHGDHSGGNENLGRAGTLIIAHDHVRVRMSSEQISAIWQSTTPPSPPGALPVVTFSDTVTFHLNSEEVHAFHVAPAHTDGDSIVHFRKADVIHMGDTFFNGMYPYIDVDSGGSIDGMIAAVERVLAMAGEGTKIVPGHGPLATRADLAAYRDMLRAARDAVAPLVAAGKTLDEVKAAHPTAALDERWGGGFMNPELFTTVVYVGLKKGTG